MNNCAMFNTDVDVKRNINEIGENLHNLFQTTVNSFLK